jgi:hypothetical protein
MCDFLLGGCLDFPDLSRNLIIWGQCARVIFLN